MSSPKKYTTVGLDLEVFVAGRAAAKEDRRSFSFIVEKALRQYLGLAGDQSPGVDKHAHQTQTLHR